MSQGGEGNIRPDMEIRTHDKVCECPQGASHCHMVTFIERSHEAPVSMTGSDTQDNPPLSCDSTIVDNGWV